MSHNKHKKERLNRFKYLHVVYKAIYKCLLFHTRGAGEGVEGGFSGHPRVQGHQLNLFDSFMNLIVERMIALFSAA